jgi:hypothetical protein
MTLTEFNGRHSIAFAKLIEYMGDDDIDGERLAPFLNSRSLPDLASKAHLIERYVPCSVYIDNLFEALRKIADESADGPDHNQANDILGKPGHYRPSL